MSEAGHFEAEVGTPGAADARGDARDDTVWTRDFHDPAKEWRRLFSEVLGTFLLVLVAVGAGVVGSVSGVPVSRAAAVTAPGLMVMAVILFMGKLGGAHLNPVVSIAFALRSEFPWRRVPGYVVAQGVGATLACLFLWAVLGRPGTFGATDPGSGISDVQALLIEAVLTMGLVSVILGTASSAQNVGALSAIAVGGYIALAGLWASPISGASMNQCAPWPRTWFVPTFHTRGCTLSVLYSAPSLLSGSRSHCAAEAATMLPSAPPQESNREPDRVSAAVTFIGGPNSVAEQGTLDCDSGTARL